MHHFYSICWVVGVFLSTFFMIGCTAVITPVAEPDDLKATVAVTPSVTEMPTLPPTSGRIEGKIFRSDRDTVLTNTTIRLIDADVGYGKDEGVIAESSVNEEGNYSFDEVKPGLYLMRVDYLYTDTRDPPCISLSLTCGGMIADTLPVGSGPNRGMVRTSAVIQTEDAFIVEAGSTIQKDIDLSCNCK